MPECQETGCGRQSASGSDYCLICKQAHNDAPTSLAENTAQIQRLAGAGRSQPPQQSFGLVGGALPLKIPEANHAPAFRTGGGDRIARFIGPLIGVVVVSLLVLTWVWLGKTIPETMRESAEMLAIQANEQSKPTTSEVPPEPEPVVVSKSDVKIWLEKTPGMQGMPHLLPIQVNEIGTVTVRVEGMDESDYDIEWHVKIVYHEVVAKHTIHVWYDDDLPLGASHGPVGERIIWATLIAKDGSFEKRSSKCSVQVSYGDVLL